jgi:hypothetical protein
MNLTVLAAAMVALVSCAGGPEETVEPSQQVDPIQQAEALPLQTAFQGLCNAETLAETGDMWGAANEFSIHAHGYLHEFADELSASDREAAGVLLEAKEAVESQLNSPDNADPATTAGALAELQVALADGAEAEGFARPACGGIGA